MKRQAKDYHNANDDSNVIKILRQTPQKGRGGDVDNFPDEWNDTRIPDGEYDLAFVAEKKSKPFGRWSWFVVMAVVNHDEHEGKLLLFPLSPVPAGTYPRRSFGIVKAYAVVTGRKPPKDFHRRKPSSFLADCIVSARTRTITKDSNGVERGEALHYSRVAYLKSLVAGTPRCLR